MKGSAKANERQWNVSETAVKRQRQGRRKAVPYRVSTSPYVLSAATNSPLCSWITATW